VGVDGVMMSLGISSGCEVLDVGCAKDAIVLVEWFILENGIELESVQQRRSTSDSLIVVLYSYGKRGGRVRDAMCSEDGIVDVTLVY
jgi:hypothetical protein